MFTDIQGYTAIMQQDEQLAVQYRDKHRRIFNAANEEYNGRILQYYGDGTLSIFDSAIDAVHCAITMQQSFQDAPAIPVRIGIHTGDIMYSEEEIIGDSVNVASRIESLAVAGSVFISEKVYDEIKNQSSIQTIRLKAFHLKNVEKPMEVYAIANEGLVIPDVEEIRGKTKPKDNASSPSSTSSISAPHDPPFLATKLFVPPPRPGAVQRDRLHAKLQQGLAGKLTLISAPAGFGKTTLVSEWAASGQHRIAWLSLEETDSNIKRFLGYFITALQSLQPGIGADILSLLQSGQAPPMENLLAKLINELAGLREKMIVVLDDYHLIDAKPVDEALAFLLDHMPPHLHLIITTREDPLLPLSRLRVRGQLKELRATDLRFTETEAAEFLNKGMGLPLTNTQVAALEARTEGWIAGLQMAALSMHGSKDTNGFINAFTGSHRFILDYLVEEVLLGQAEEVRQFLMQTAVLNRLSGPLCNAVTGRTDSEQLLSELERDNLFVIPLDDQRLWYRYHHLFSEMLRAHLAREQAALLPGLHRRAAEWYEANNAIAEAIYHALAGEDYDGAADMIERAWPAMDAQFQTDIWLNWFEKLPEDLTAKRPVLLMACAWAHLNRGALKEGAVRLQELESLLDQTSEPDKASTDIVVADQEQFRYLTPSLVSARSFIALAHGNTADTLKYARRALELYPEDDPIRRGPAAALLGLAAWNIGELEAAHEAITAAMRNFEMAGSYEFAISGTYGLADLRMAQGRLRDAVRTYERVLTLVAEKGLQQIRGTADLYLGLGELHLERGDPETAAQLISKSEEMGAQMALPDWPCRLHIVKAKLQETKGDLDGALKHLQEAEKLYYRTPLPLTHPIPARVAQLWIRQGQLAAAKRWAREQELSPNDELHYLKEYEHFTLARILLAEYRNTKTPERLQEAISLLDRLLRAAEKGERNGSVLQILILQALAHDARQDIPSALEPLARAVRMAAPEGYVQTFVAEGAPMAHLLSQTLAQGISPDYVAELLSAFGDESIAQPVPAIKTQTTPTIRFLIEPLSERELEILQLIARGLSNQEISRKLFLALSTVKGHNRNIFAKLDVQRRTEAVARARELGLLG
jgi:LuxR family maltose regulon positive regulatory protein